jgi:ribosomal protein S18 acetylase RimI-like enzyme
MTIVVRRVDINNALVRAGVSAMDVECFPLDQPFVPAEGFWWVAFDDKKEAAYIGFKQSNQGEHTAYLERVGVLPKYRGNGLQVRLTRLALAYLRKNGWDTVVTDTRRNPASANSLINCGFKTYEPQYPWSFVDAVYWRRVI